MHPYQALVREVLAADAATIQPSHGAVDSLLLIDEAQGSYLVLYIGWSGDVRHHNIIVHLRVMGDKIWIEHDGTPERMATILRARGVPADDIVRGFQHPRKRRLSGFALVARRGRAAISTCAIVTSARATVLGAQGSSHHRDGSCGAASRCTATMVIIATQNRRSSMRGGGSVWYTHNRHDVSIAQPGRRCRLRRSNLRYIVPAPDQSGGAYW
jgi:hypothetical protein